MPSMPGIPIADQRLCSAMEGWPSPAAGDARQPFLIGVLPGEGVGPEVIDVTLDLLDVLAAHTPCRFTLRTGGPIGLEAQREQGQSLTDEVADFCTSVFNDGGALLCGPGGGRFVYDLRARFDLYCKLIPLYPFAALHDARPAACRTLGRRGHRRRARKHGWPLLRLVGRASRRRHGDGRLPALHLPGERSAAHPRRGPSPGATAARSAGGRHQARRRTRHQPALGSHVARDERGRRRGGACWAIAAACC